MRHLIRKLKFIASAGASLAVIFSAHALDASDGATIQDSRWSENSLAQQREIPNAGFNELYVNAGANFARYQTILIEDVSITFIPRWERTHREAVNRREVARLKSALADDLKTELVEKLTAGGRYRIVEEAEIDTLVIKPEIIDLNVAAPGSGHATLVDSAGYATLSLEMYDAYSDQRVVKIVDWKQAKDTSGRDFFMANRATNARAFRRLMDDWAERVRIQLDVLSAPRDNASALESGGLSP